MTAVASSSTKKVHGARSEDEKGAAPDYILRRNKTVTTKAKSLTLSLDMKSPANVPILPATSSTSASNNERTVITPLAASFNGVSFRESNSAITANVEIQTIPVSEKPTYAAVPLKEHTPLETSSRQWTTTLGTQSTTLKRRFSLAKPQTSKKLKEDHALKLKEQARKIEEQERHIAQLVSAHRLDQELISGQQTSIQQQHTHIMRREEEILRREEKLEQKYRELWQREKDLAVLLRQKSERSYKVRLADFANAGEKWDLRTKPSAAAMARAGWYFSPVSRISSTGRESRYADNVQCAYCGAEAYEWDKDDDPVGVHEEAAHEGQRDCLLLNLEG